MVLIVAIPSEEADKVVEFYNSKAVRFYARTEFCNYLTVIDPKSIVAKERSELEEDPTYRQLIAYGVVYNPQEKTIFRYQRLGGTGEKRLVGNKSIGIGGHTDYFERYAFYRIADIMVDALDKEISEELEPIKDKSKFIRGIDYYLSAPIGTPILLNETDVDKVHMGIVYLVTTTRGISIHQDEKHVNEGKMVPIKELIKDIEENPDSYEKWSIEAFNRIKEIV